MEMPLSEQQLIEGIRAGDSDAFNMMFRSYYSMLYHIARGILRDEGWAEEVVQDVFIKIWESGEKLSINTSLSAYLMTMTRNRCFDYLRAQARQLKTISIHNLEVQEELHRYGFAGFDEELFSDRTEIKLKKALEQLPPQCGEIFKLNRFEGFSIREIADKLHLSISTVKTQITRALQKLRDALDSP
jgi:RNA polymerase sigma-70 factor (ECF subfamily)